MRRCAWIAAVILALVASRLAFAGEPPNCQPDRPRILQRVAPAGGWFPDAGGLLRWWNPHCIPCCRGPDDYCRKPLPCLCWPAYPSFYFGYPPGRVTGERTP
jgi:hypothetical protein